jgi:hypothetical protein
MIEVYYYSFGQKFTLKMNREQAIKELKAFGWPMNNPEKLSDRAINEMVQEIYTGYS